MADYHRIAVTFHQQSGAAVVRFTDRKILDQANIAEMGDELLALVDQEGRQKILLNFTGVEFLSSAALNKLISLNRRLGKTGGQLRVSNLGENIKEVFVITNLTKVFVIFDNEAEALASFQ